MTTTAQGPTSTATDADAAVVAEFFDAYRAQDIETMTDLCADVAEFDYPPFESWGKQRVIRGYGKVGTVGKVLWTGLVVNFPDLTNTVHNIVSDGDGNVAVEVTIGGTQSGDWGPITSKGQAFAVPHLFLFHVSDGRIDKIKAYWDNALLCRQLGHLEVD